MKDLEYYRKLVVGVDLKIPVQSGKWVTNINFDNAASTPPLSSTLQSIIQFAPLYSSVHRGAGYKSQVSTNLYEITRQIVCNFVKADPHYYTVIFVKNTTEAINKLSYRLYTNNKEDVVLSTTMEHHSNDLPWRHKFQVDYITVDEKGKLSLKDLEAKLIHYKGKVKLVTLTGASNVTGYINPIQKAAALTHKYGAKILVDGAQLIPHAPFHMGSIHSPEHIDFLAFSGHKMYCPFGIGVLIGPKKFFSKGMPDYVGGGTIKFVTHDFVQWADAPYKDEAGSPNVFGAIALSETIKTLSSIGWREIQKHEKNLIQYTLDKIKRIPDIILYGNSETAEGRVGVISFNIKDLPHEAVANILSHEAGIAVRSGCFCAQPYVQKLLKISPEQIKKNIEQGGSNHPGMVRISLGFYNTFEEIDILFEILRKIVKNKNKYLQKYISFS